MLELEPKTRRKSRFTKRRLIPLLPEDDTVWMTAQQVAEYQHVSLSTVQRRTKNEELPHALNMANRPLYRKSDVDRFFNRTYGVYK